MVHKTIILKSSVNVKLIKVSYTSIESFIIAEEQLREEMELVIRDIEFNYYPKIREWLLEFIEASLKYNQKSMAGSKKNKINGWNRSGYGSENS